MARKLCWRCHQSFEESEIVQTPSGPMCSGCAEHALAVAPPAASTPPESAAAPGDRVDPNHPEPARSGWRPEPKPVDEIAPEGFLPYVAWDARKWCVGRIWQIRLLFFAWCCWMLYNYLGNPIYDPSYRSLLDGINFGIHEAGHFVFTPLGRFMHFAGGTICQCAAPVAAFFIFRRQRDYFAMAFTFGWLGSNLFDVAVYVYDARSTKLDLVGPSEGHVIHDWNYMLYKLGLMQWDHTFGYALKTLGAVSMLICLAAMAWLMWQMFRQPDPNAPGARKGRGESA